MKKEKLKYIIILFFLLCLQSGLFAARYGTIDSNTEVNFESYQYTKPVKINVPSDLSYNSISSSSANLEKTAYPIGLTSIDFSENNSDYDDIYLRNYDSYKDSYLVDSNNGEFDLQLYAKIEAYNSYNSIESTYWANLDSDDSIDLHNNSYYYNISKITIRYYFIIDDIANLDTSGGDWKIIVNYPTSYNSSYDRANIYISYDDYYAYSNDYGYYYNRYYDYSVNSDTFYDETLKFNYSYYVDKLNYSDIADNTTLNVNIENLFNSSNTDFFNGEKNDYYQINFSLYKNDYLSSDDFNVAFSISSLNDFKVISQEDSTKSVSYSLYLKYYKNGRYRTKNLTNYTEYKNILVKNLNSSSNSKDNLILATKSTALSENKMVVGIYSDTIYINFITDDSINDSSFNSDISISL